MTGPHFVPDDPLGPARQADPAVLADHAVHAHQQRMSGEITSELQVVIAGRGCPGDPSGNPRGCRHNHAHLE